MTTSKRYAKCISFARFVREHGVEPTDLAELLTLADRAFRAGEREANTGRSADGARERFEAKARGMRFGVKWPGLLPSLTRAGRDIYLPGV
jgi:hypothetical protein